MKTNWQTKKLGEIFFIERGGSPRPIQKYLTSDPAGINWIKIGDTNEGDKYITKTEQKIKPDGLKKTRLVHPGDFILSNSMSFGRPYIMKISGAIHDGWLAMRENLKDIDKDFFYYLLGSPIVFEQFDKLASGSTVRNLNTKLVAGVEVIFPPLDEQRRIVKILDEVFEKTEKAKENAEKNLKNSHELFESYLQSIFANPGNGWDEYEIGDLCEVVAGQSPEGKYYNSDGNGLPFYQGKKEFTEKYIGAPRVWTTQITKEAQEGDILMSVRAPVGPVNFSTEKICIGRGLAAIRAGREINKELLFYFFQSFEKQITGNTGAVFNSINKKQIEDIKVSIPSLKEQNFIVKKLDELSEKTKKLEEIYSKKLADLEELKKSVLKKAFSGEL